MILTETNLDGILPLIARGKVRDIYEVNEKTLLFIATDRISAYDVIMENPVPNKGKLLTQLSLFWFEFLKNDIRNHLVPIDGNRTIFDYLPKELSNSPYREQIEDRSILVHKHKLIPLEAIVRGYITGSAWKEYCAKRTIHGQDFSHIDLKESQELQEPIFTPSTKAEQGQHDENISVEQASELIGKDLCDRIDKISRQIYTKCKEFAKTKGIIIADTKFEFGIDGNEIILVDEVLTPDSSRFWDGKKYVLGKSQDSYDKQFLRDWLTKNKLNGVEGVTMPDDIVKNTALKYTEAYESLTGRKFK